LPLSRRSTCEKQTEERKEKGPGCSARRHASLQDETKALTMGKEKKKGRLKYVFAECDWLREKKNQQTNMRENGSGAGGRT
jgi:hypothetical protein